MGSVTKARAVENQHSFAIRNHRTQSPPQQGRRPRGVGDEMLERLVGAGVADACQHRAHRLAATVAQQAQQIPTKRPALGGMPKAGLEGTEPCAQPIQPRRRIAREHCTAAYPLGDRMTNVKN